MIARAHPALLALALCGCASHAPFPGSRGRGGGRVERLALRRVDWNGGRVDSGPVDALLDGGDVVVVFGESGATILRAGAVSAVDRGFRARSDGAMLPGADGRGRWLTALDRSGRPHRLRAGSRFEPIDERLGLAGVAAGWVCAPADPLSVFAIGEGEAAELAISDGARIRRYAAGWLREPRCGGHRVAALGRGGLEVIDLTGLAGQPGLTGLAVQPGLAGAAARSAPVGPLGGDGGATDPELERHAFVLPEAVEVAVDGSGRVYARTGRAIYALTDEGQLALRYVAAGDTLRGLAASGTRLWFADGSELGFIERRGGADRVALASGGAVAAGARLSGSPSGDVWILESGRLLRYAPDEPAEPTEAADGPGWSSAIQPVFARTCAACHAQGGKSGIDLSTAAAWAGRRGVIRERVVEQRTMPPRDRAFPEADREAIRAWLARP